MTTRLAPVHFSSSKPLIAGVTTIVLGGASALIGYGLDSDFTYNTAPTADRFERVQQNVKNGSQINSAAHDWIAHIEHEMRDLAQNNPELAAFFDRSDNHPDVPTNQDPWYNRGKAIELSGELLSRKPPQTFSDLQPLMNEFADQYYVGQPALAKEYKALSTKVIQQLQSENTREIWSQRLFGNGLAVAIGTVLLTMAIGIASTHDVHYGIGADGQPVTLFIPKKRNED